jgi:hypothetical protein
MELIPLHDGRPGIRTFMQVETREPELASLDSGASSAVLDFVSSTGTLDRYHEVIDPAGWRLDSYRRNPVFQNAHNYGDILFTLGKALITDVRQVAGRQALFQRVQFATDVNPIARIAYGLYKGAFLNAVSVGFIPLRWEDAPPGTDGVSAASPCRRKYVEQELLEVSAVAIPANPDALALGVKNGAITKSDLTETLDLLRCLSVDYGPWRPPEPLRDLPYQRQSAFISGSLLTFARELRRILRRP